MSDAPPSISFVIATVGNRASIQRTLESIETWTGDEIIVIGGPSPDHDQRVRHISCPPGGDWGHSERNRVVPHLKGDYVAHIDDDDYYNQGHRALMASAIEQAPDRPSIFRMQYPSGMTLWSQPVACLGNVGTPMFLLPNEPQKFGTWAPFNGGDFDFLRTCQWPLESINWRPEVTVKLGHD